MELVDSVNIVYRHFGNVFTESHSLKFSRTSSQCVIIV